MIQRFAALATTLLILAFGLPALADPPVTLTFAAGDSYIERATFQPGETVMVYETGAQPQHQDVSFEWYDAANTLRQSTVIYGEGWSDGLVLPTDSPLGAWRVRVYDSMDGGNVLAEKTFIVDDGSLAIGVPASARQATTLSISSSMNPARYGRPLTLTARIAGGDGQTQGTISFSMDHVAIPDCGNVPVIGSEARCTTADLPAGVHGLVASYSGDNSDLGATSAFIKQYIKAYGQGAFRDLDADGTSDMVLRRADGALIARLVGGTSVYQEAELLPAGSAWQVIHFGDINHDAKADMVLRHPSGEVAVWLMDGTRAAVKYTAIAASENLAFVGVADIDGDGRDEIVVRAADGKLSMRILGNRGITATVALPAYLAGLDIVRVADFDGDGRDDLLLADAQGNLSMELMRGAGKSVRFAPLVPAGLDARHLTHVGDFDGDGKMDLLFRDDAGRVISWLVGRNVAVEALPGTKWTVTHVGDFDGDGTHDLVLRTAGGEVAVALMADGAALSPANTYAVGGYKVAQLGDFNGDGISDLLLEGPRHELVIWIMNGNNIGAEAVAAGPSDWLAYP